jgi:hypothetical protein
VEEKTSNRRYFIMRKCEAQKDRGRWLPPMGVARKMIANTNGHAFPRDFVSMRPWLISPAPLVCPGMSKVRASDWSSFDFTNVTYEMVGPAISEVDDYAKPFVQCRKHGYVCYGDGWAPNPFCVIQHQKK